MRPRGAAVGGGAGGRGGGDFPASVNAFRRGFFANLLGCALAARIAAIAPVAGALDLGACVPARPVPVLLLYGRADHVVSAALIVAARGWWAHANGCGTAATDGGCEHYTGCSADVVYCEGPQAHRWPAGATGRIWRFFESHPAV